MQGHDLKPRCETISSGDTGERPKCLADPELGPGLSMWAPSDPRTVAKHRGSRCQALGLPGVPSSGRSPHTAASAPAQARLWAGDARAWASAQHRSGLSQAVSFLHTECPGGAAHSVGRSWDGLGLWLVQSGWGRWQPLEDTQDAQGRWRATESCGQAGPRAAASFQGGHWGPAWPRETRGRSPVGLGLQLAVGWPGGHGGRSPPGPATSPRSLEGGAGPSPPHRLPSGEGLWQGGLCRPPAGGALTARPLRPPFPPPCTQAP